MDILKRVRCSNEHDLRQVKGRGQEMIGKLVVLSRVENFKEGRTRVTSVTLPHLVDLIEKEHWVVGLDFLE